MGMALVNTPGFSNADFYNTFNQNSTSQPGSTPFAQGATPALSAEQRAQIAAQNNLFTNTMSPQSLMQNYQSAVYGQPLTGATPEIQDFIEFNTPTAEQQQAQKQAATQQYLTRNPYNQSMGGTQDLYNKYADYAANLNYQPGPIFSMAFRNPDSYSDWMKQQPPAATQGGPAQGQPQIGFGGGPESRPGLTDGFGNQIQAGFNEDRLNTPQLRFNVGPGGLAPGRPNVNQYSGTENAAEQPPVERPSLGRPVEVGLQTGEALPDLGNPIPPPSGQAGRANLGMPAPKAPVKPAAPVQTPAQRLTAQRALAAQQSQQKRAAVAQQQVKAPVKTAAKSVPVRRR